MRALQTLGGRRRIWGRTGRLLGIVLAAIGLFVGAAIPASAAELMRVTFVRHGESAGNASGLIDTSTPGPVLTQTGQQQAQAVPGRLGVNNYDAIYASTMVRTQLTAAPMSQYLGLPIQVLPGLQEIEAGAFEGTPESQAAQGYGLFPVAWALQGNRDLRIPGSINGHEFDARMDAALKTMYDNGDRNAVVYSHGGAIMFWTMMNATNLTTAQKLDLLRNFALKNTEYVVVEGNDEDGWVLVDWNGQKFAPEATLGAEVQLQLRTLQRQLAATVKQVVDSFATLNPAAVLAAIVRGVGEAVFSVTKFAGAVANKVSTEIAKIGQPAPAPEEASTPASTSSATTNTAAAQSFSPDVSDAKSQAVASRSSQASAVGDDNGSSSVVTSTKKPEPSDKPTVPAQPEVTPNGATNLKDGNKVEPPTTGTGDGDGATAGGDAPVTVGTDVEAGAADADADAGGQGEGAAA